LAPAATRMATGITAAAVNTGKARRRLPGMMISISVPVIRPLQKWPSITPSAAAGGVVTRQDHIRFGAPGGHRGGADER
jgi:hypothetical protein